MFRPECRFLAGLALSLVLLAAASTQEQQQSEYSRNTLSCLFHLSTSFTNLSRPGKTRETDYTGKKFAKQEKNKRSSHKRDLFRPNMKNRKERAALWAAKLKRKGHPEGCPFLLEGTVKIDILKSRKGIGEPPNRPSGRRRLCAVRGFAAGKTSAEAEFTSAEHLNRRRVKPPSGRRNPKRKT